MSIRSSGLLLLRYYAGMLLAAVSNGYELECPSIGESGPWVTPGTLCRSYYICSRGQPIIKYCSGNTIFDPKSKHCVSSGPCYEAVCVGRKDGSYLDPTESCTRKYWCSGGRLVKVNVETSTVDICPPVSSFAAKLIHRPNRCKSKLDGRYNRDDNCSGFYECRARNEIKEILCPKGIFFDGKKCNEQTKYCLNICSNKKDGFYSDASKDCIQYVKCSEGSVKERFSCPAQTAFNGNSCVPQETFFCPGRDQCSSLPDGFHLESCENYIKCEKGRTLFSAECPKNEYFNGVSCISNSWLKCDTPHFSKVCLGKDGFFNNHTTGCSTYYHCSREGNKIDFTCPTNYLFNGSLCVHSETFLCPFIRDSCEDKKEGYYIQAETGCQTYYYCFNSNQITYHCPKAMSYNGIKCVPSSSFVCSDDLSCNEVLEKKERLGKQTGLSRTEDI